ncbi:ankyrin, partial [Zopfia rhizophila CBS 207.26]
GFDANTGKGNGQTALHVAASHGNEDMAMLLLDHGANIHAEEDKSGYTPLDMAVEEDRQRMALLLLQRGADVMDGKGLPMFLAKTNGHDGMARLLIKHGADIEGHE